jgi:hypothetical protein
MVDDGNGKALAVRRAKPEIIVHGNKAKSPDVGRWHLEMMADYLLKIGLKNWISVGTLSSIAYGNKSKDNMKRVRHRLAGLFNALLRRDHILLTALYGRRTEHVKILDRESAIDRHMFDRKLEQLKNSKETADEKVARAQELFDAYQPPALPEAPND